MSRWYGPQYKGAMRDMRKLKREEAEMRQLRAIRRAVDWELRMLQRQAVRHSQGTWRPVQNVIDTL